MEDNFFFFLKTEAALQGQILTDFQEGPRSFPPLTPLVPCRSGVAPDTGYLSSACGEHLCWMIPSLYFPDQPKGLACFWFEKLQRVEGCKPILAVLFQASN